MREREAILLRRIETRIFRTVTSSDRSGRCSPFTEVSRSKRRFELKEDFIPILYLEMKHNFDYIQMVHIVRFVDTIARNEPDDVQTAIMFTVRNCLKRGREHDLEQSVSEICTRLSGEAGLAGEFSASAPEFSFSHRSHCRLFGSLCWMLSSDLPDPSDGAVRFHRHETLPPWAHSRVPSALLGSFFFYNEPTLGLNELSAADAAEGARAMVSQG